MTGRRGLPVRSQTRTDVLRPDRPRPSPRCPPTTSPLQCPDSCWVGGGVRSPTGRTRSQRGTHSSVVSVLPKAVEYPSHTLGFTTCLSWAGSSVGNFSRQTMRPLGGGPRGVGSCPLALSGFPPRIRLPPSGLGRSGAPAQGEPGSSAGPARLLASRGPRPGWVPAPFSTPTSPSPHPARLLTTVARDPGSTGARGDCRRARPPSPPPLRRRERSAASAHAGPPLPALPRARGPTQASRTTSPSAPEERPSVHYSHWYRWVVSFT